MGEDARSLRLAAKLDSLAAATEFARRGAREAGFPEERLGHLDLVVEELFVNIASYAYAGEEIGDIEVRFAIPGPGLLSLEMADQGLEYDPLTLREPNLPGSLNDRPVGGLGVFLVRQLTRALNYSRENGWNRLRFEMESADPSK